jgi:hypothetical protein
MIAPPKPPAHDELEALIKEARARQLRRRLLGAAGVAVAAAVGIIIYAFITGGAVSNVPQQPTEGGRARVSLCRSSQLSMSIGGQGATQMILGGALITNTGGEACALPNGRPVVRLTWQGRPMQVAEPVPKPGEVQSGRPAHILASGAKALISMRMGNWCGFQAPGLPTFRLVFGDGLTLSAPGLGAPICIGPGSPAFLDVSAPLVAN